MQRVYQDNEFFRHDHRWDDEQRGAAGFYPIGAEPDAVRCGRLGLPADRQARSVALFQVELELLQIISVWEHWVQ
jgi:hypothetical protein